MNDLIREIEGLSREQALEAAGFLSRQLAPDSGAGETERTLLEPLTAEPYRNIEEIEQLARIVLMSAALDPEYEAAVRKAVEGAGRKQYILGGAEIVALAAICLLALQAVIARGKSSESETISIEDDGEKTSTFIHKEVTYGVSPKLGAILKAYLTGGK